MKRFLIALLVGGVVFGTVFAAAASLGVTGGTLQMSYAVDATCDQNGVTLGYLFFDSDGDPDTDNDIITEAQVGDIAAACEGEVVTVEIFGPGDALCDGGEKVFNGTDDPLVIDVLDYVAGDCKVLDARISFVNIASPAVWP